MNVDFPVRAGFRRRSLEACALLCVAFGCAIAPAGELARLAPADLGLCLETDRLAERLDAFSRDEIFTRLENYPPLMRWSAEHGPALAEIGREFGRQLDSTPEALWADAFSRGALFAVWPSSEPGGDDGPGLLLIETRDATLPERIFDAVAKAQPPNGVAPRNEVRTVGNRTYRITVIEPSGDQPPVFLAALGSIGLVTNSPRVLDEVLRLDADGASDIGPLSELSIYQTAMSRLDPQAAARLFLNPRPWDPLFESPSQENGDEPDHALIEASIDNQLRALWRAADYGAASLTINERVVVEGICEFRPQDIPPAWRMVVDNLGGETRFFDRIPADVLAAVAGRVNLGRIARLLFESDERGATAAPLPIEAKLVGDLLAGFGPEAGSFLVHEPVLVHELGDENSADRLPLGWVVAFATQPRWAGDMGPALVENLDRMLRGGLLFATSMYNAYHGAELARLEFDRASGVVLTSIAGVKELGPDTKLTYAFQRGDLLLGTSREAVRRAVELSPTEAPSLNRRVSDLQSPRLAQPSHIAYVDLKGFAERLTAEPAFVNVLASADEVSREEAEHNLAELVSLLSLADSLLAEARIRLDGVRVAVTLATDPNNAPPQSVAD